MRDTERPKLERAPPLSRCRFVEPPAKLPAARIDTELATRLGVDEPEVTDVCEFLLARVANLDRNDMVA